MILIFTGNGKGKTTAGLGAAIRALGWGFSVRWVYFDKGGSHYGEHHILKFLQENFKGASFKFFQFGLPRFNEKKQTFRFENTKADKKEAALALKKVNELKKTKPFLIIGDEIINAMNLGLLPVKNVKALIHSWPKETHLILTGRNAPLWLISAADLVSDVGLKKHYFKNAKKAIKGLEY